MDRVVSRGFGATLAWSLALFSLQLAAACGSDDQGDTGHDHDGHEHDQEHDHSKPVGPPSGATCPTGSTLTYDNFGKQFMTDYCTSCHSKDVTGPARKTAPSDHNFDTLAEVQLMGDHIDQKAASGPSSTNVSMPPSDPKPSMEERQKLGEWIACGAP